MFLHTQLLILFFLHNRQLSSLWINNQTCYFLSRVRRHFGQFLFLQLSLIQKSLYLENYFVQAAMNHERNIDYKVNHYKEAGDETDVKLN